MRVLQPTCWSVSAEPVSISWTFVTLAVVCICHSCSCSVITNCSPLPTLPNTTISSTNTSVGSVVTYICLGGDNQFGLNLTSLNVTCSASDGKWTPNITKGCSPAPNCGMAPLLQFATISKLLSSYNTVITYRCISGYWFPDISGTTKNIQCTGTPPSWSPVLPATTMPSDCQPILCNKLSLPLNSWADTYAWTAGTVANVWCKVGSLYENGERAVQSACTRSLQWQLTVRFTPRCLAVTCALPSVSNAVSTNSNQSSYIFEEQLTLSCNGSMYQFPGGNTTFKSTCTSTGTVVPQPPLSGCQSVKPDCGYLPWVYYNGSCYLFSNTTDQHVFQQAEDICTSQNSHLAYLVSKIEVTYIAVATQQSAVGAVDYWIGYSQDSNMKWTWVSGYSLSNYTNWLLGYPDGSGSCAVISYKGGWKNRACNLKAAYICKKSTVCRSPPVIDNGNATVSPVPSYLDMSASLVYNCFNGYWVPSTKKKKQTLTCMASGAWSPIESCQGIRCPAKVRILNAVPNTTSNAYGTYVAYTCKPGYTYPDGSTTMVARCKSDGQWHGILTECQKIRCPKRASSFATFIYGWSNVGAVDVYACQEGYEYPDGTTVTRYNCLDTGIWSPDIACQKVRCPIYNQSHVGLNVTSNQYLGATTVTCPVGYRFFYGNKTYQQRNVTCMANKTWSEQLPSCTALSCASPPPVVLNATANTSAITVGTVVNYTCQSSLTFIDGEAWRTAYCDPSTVLWTSLPSACIDPARILKPTFPDIVGLNSKVFLIGQSLIIGMIVLAVAALLLEICQTYHTTTSFLPKSE